MQDTHYIWQILAGVGVFLIGIRMLESGLKQLMGRPFKLFLQKHTGNPIKAIAGGTIVTSLLQSSSAVNFMVLAFVSTGVLTMQNAFAVIMGNNLGSTVSGWIIATIGFKFEIEAFAFPIIGLAGIVWFIFTNKPRLQNICVFLIGFSLLFIGLSYMKNAIGNEEIQHVFSRFAESSNWVFLFIGFIITSITQSSSATVAITLSILNQKLIGFDAAMAVVIGSEVGTSLKLILGSLDGIAVKKRVSTGNIIYNFITTIIAFTLLQQIAFFITEILSVKDPLIGLMIFQSGINLVSIFLFLPFLNPYTRLLEKLFSDTQKTVSVFINKIQPDMPEVAIELLKQETRLFVQRCIQFNLHAFGIYALRTTKNEYGSEYANALLDVPKDFEKKYTLLKQHHGEIQSFYMAFIKQTISPHVAEDVEELIAAVRSSMHASKCIKDMQADLHEMQNTTQEVRYAFYKDLRSETEQFYLQLSGIEAISDPDEIANRLLVMLEENKVHYKHNLHIIYQSEQSHSLPPVDIATMMNMNRELFTSDKSMIMCFKNLLLPKEYQSQFSELPTYQS